MEFSNLTKVFNVRFREFKSVERGDQSGIEKEAADEGQEAGKQATSAHCHGTVRTTGLLGQSFA